MISPKWNETWNMKRHRVVGIYSIWGFDICEQETVSVVAAATSGRILSAPRCYRRLAQSHTVKVMTTIMRL